MEENAQGAPKNVEYFPPQISATWLILEQISFLIIMLQHGYIEQISVIFVALTHTDGAQWSQKLRWGFLKVFF
jgi:hypothetical protein